MTDARQARTGCGWDFQIFLFFFFFFGGRIIHSPHPNNVSRNLSKNPGNLILEFTVAIMRKDRYGFLLINKRKINQNGTRHTRWYIHLNCAWFFFFFKFCHSFFQESSHQAFLLACDLPPVEIKTIVRTRCASRNCKTLKSHKILN